MLGMSGLKNIINGMQGDPSSATNGTPTAPSNGESLGQFAPIDPQQPQATPAGGVVPDTAHNPDAPPSSPSTAAEFQFREELQQRLGGADLSQFETNEELLDGFTQLISHARDELNSPEYQAFVAQKNSPSPEPAPTPAPVPADPAANPAAANTASAPSSSGSFVVAQPPSETARLLQQAGRLIDEGGVVVAKEPALQQYADEINNYHLAKRTNANFILDDPSSVIEAEVQRRLNSMFQSDDNQFVSREQFNKQQELIQQLLERDQSRTQSEAAYFKAEEQKFIEDFSNSPDVRGADGKLTPWAQEYQKHEREIAQSYPDITVQDLHRRTLDHMEKFSNVKRPSEAPAEPAKTESFMTAANRNGNGAVNRIASFAETGAQPPSNPGDITGKGGKPSLKKVIALKQSETPIT